MQTQHPLTQAQRQERREKKQALLLSLTEAEWQTIQGYSPAVRLADWTLAELEAGRERMRYDEAHPNRFTGDGKKALKELYGEV